ncbi:MAG TPA: M42 family metallopeptidase [Anaerolineae bacterium]|nr:M42 family metallopeptidase [Anaerolineae bacterium]
MNNNWELLNELCAVHAVSGREDLMIRFIYNYIKTLVDEIEVDRIGNVIGVIKGKSEPDCRLMLQAHIDELGLIVRNITDNGFLLLERVGGMPEKSLLGQWMDVLTEEEKIFGGFIGTKSHHITTREEKYKVPNIHEMYIDIGLSTREAVNKAGIQVGDPVTYHPNFREFGEGLICSKALDNRVSVYVLLKVLEFFKNNRPNCSLAFAFTVLEEFSIRGSTPAVVHIDPHAIISLDITIAVDDPYSPHDLQPVVLGGGPAIKMMDFHGRGTLAGHISSPPLKRYIERVAKERKIPLQREVIVGVITEPAFQIYLGEHGYTVAAISIPSRYSHSAVQVVNKSDVEQTIKWVIGISEKFNKDVDLQRG